MEVHSTTNDIERKRLRDRIRSVAPSTKMIKVPLRKRTRDQGKEQVTDSVGEYDLSANMIDIKFELL